VDFGLFGSLFENSETAKENMDIATLITNGAKLMKKHAPEIMTAIAASGVITAYFSSTASVKASKVLEDMSPDMPASHKIKKTWKLYIPAGVSGAVTIGCIIGASKANSRRTAAAVTAYSITEKAFSEYKEKVVEELGKNKEQKLRDEIVENAVKNNPKTQEVIVLGRGNVLCCELYTGRYFRSDMETLRKCENIINQKINNELYVTLDEFYNLLSLTYTSHSNEVGWTSDKLLELQFTSVIAEDGEPCLAFEYNYVKPIH
jgi:hypothetical protein